MRLRTLHYILVSLAITATLFFVAWNSFKNMTLDTSMDQIIGTDGRVNDTYEKFNKAFQNDTVIMAIAKIDKLFSNDGARTLYDISNAFQSIPGFKDVKSLTHSARPVKGKLSLDLSKMITFKNFMDLQPKSHEEWRKLKRFITEYPMTRDILVSSDGQYAVIIAVLESNALSIEQKRQLASETDKKMAPFIEKGIDIHLLSEPFLAAEFYGLINEFLVQFITISLLLLSVTIYITFKSFKILTLILTYQIAGFMIFPLIFQLNGTNINVFTFIIIPLVSALHLTFLIHFFSVFQHEINKNDTLKTALYQSLEIVLKPSTIALITSSIGLGALIVSDVEVLKKVGLMGLQSLVGVFAITFIPAILLSLGHKKVNTPVEAKTSKELPFLKFVDRAKFFILAMVLVSGSLVSFFAYKINTDVRIKEFLVSTSKTRTSLNLLDEHFGGINVLKLTVTTAKAGDIQNYEVISYLHKLRKKAMALDGVLNAYTYSQFYTTIHQLFLGDNLSAGEVLPDKSTAYMYSTIINSTSFPFQDILQSSDRQSTVFFLRTRDLPIAEFLKVIGEFEVLANQDAPAGVKLQIQDGVHTILRSNRQIVQTQIYSLATSLTCIFLCLFVIYRSLKLAVITFFCNLVPLICIGALMIIFNIPINAVTVMVGSIIMGISVDDSIHFLSFYKKLHKRYTVREAISETLRHKLRPIICTSIILIICLLMLMMSPFTPIKDFGLLGGLSLFSGLLSSCVLLPGLLLLEKK